MAPKSRSPYALPSIARRPACSTRKVKWLQASLVCSSLKCDMQCGVSIPRCLLACKCYCTSPSTLLVNPPIEWISIPELTTSSTRIFQSIHSGKALRAFLPVLSPRMEDLGAGPVAINVIYVTDLIIPGTDISEVPKLDVTHGVMPAGLPKRPLVLRTPPRTVS